MAREDTGDRQSAPNIIDRLMGGPGWRAGAIAAEDHWRKTFRTPTPRLLEAQALEAAIKSNGRGNRPW